MKTSVKTLLFLLVSISFNYISAQKVCYVKETEILKSIPDYEKNTKFIDSLRITYENQLKNEGADLDKKLTNLLSNYKIGKDETLEMVKKRLKPADLKKIEDYAKETDDLQKKSKKLNDELQIIYKEKIQIKLDQVNKVMSEFAKKNKYDLIYKFENISPALAFIEEKLDVTKDIIKLLK